MLKNWIIRKRTLQGQLENSGKVPPTPPPETFTNTVGKVIEILQEKLPLMLEKLTFVFHHNFYPKPKVDP